MTWQTFFDFSTMAHRHLVFVYVGVITVQLAYVGWLARNWSKSEPRK
jgi:hypothetical protein